MHILPGTVGGGPERGRRSRSHGWTGGTPDGRIKLINIFEFVDEATE